MLQADGTIDSATIGFHYQQAAEKLLKAVLAEQNVDYPRTHNLAALIDLLKGIGYEVPVSEQELISLTPFAVTSRYEEGEETQQIDPVQVGALIEQLREWVQAELR